MAAPYKNLDTAALNAALAEMLPSPDPGHDDTPLEDTSLHDALGRIAQKTVAAPHDLPALPVATMDGYCLGPGGADYRVVAQSVPGGTVPQPPGPGEAVFVMTGGPLPENATGVVPREQTDGGDHQIRINNNKAVTPMAAGARIRAGSALVRAGQRIGPNQVAALAEYGIWRLAVHGRPRVDLLAVGSEFGHDHNAPNPLTHHNGNGPHLAALVSLCGGQPSLQPAAADDRGAIAGALNRCTAPLILTTGGTAKGRFDLTAEAVADAGFNWVIDGLRLRPGQSTRVATRGGQILVSLPGSPGAIAPLFCLLIRPILARLCGDKAPPAPIHGRLMTAVTRPRPVPLLSAATVWVDDTGGVCITPRRDATDGYTLLPEGNGPLATGTVLPLYPAPGLGWSGAA